MPDEHPVTATPPARPAAGTDPALESALAVLGEVARDVRLQEGESGALRMLRSIVKLAPAATRDISRDTRLPVPVVAAVQSELRSRGLLGRERPSRLTAGGRELAATLGMTGTPVPDVGCPRCDGDQIVVPPELETVVRDLEAIVAAGPAADMALDQSHATARTKVRRVLQMLHMGALPTPSLLAIGDDDLISVATVKVAAQIGVPLARQIVVVDISAEILAEIEAHTRGSGVPVELVRHDLREPLPAVVRNTGTVAMTDPPYTTPGAGLFLSRAIEGLRPGPGRDVFFHFGAKGPDDGFEIEQLLVGLGFQTTALVPNFNEYIGSGTLGGVGHARHLVTTTHTAAAAPDGAHSGPLYTSDVRRAAREYRCTTCDHRYVVGPGQHWQTVGMLKQHGCPNCGEHRFAPGQLVQPAADGNQEP